MLDSNWKYLADVAQVIMGQSPPSSTYNTVGEGLPFYQGKTDFGDMYPTPRVYCTEPSRIAEAGDILISVRAPVGPTNISREKSAIGRGLSVIRVGEKLDRDFLLYFLRFYEPELAKAGTGSTFAAIAREDLETIKIPLPPLTEQKRIASLLARADYLRHLRRTAHELGESLLQSVFLEMFGHVRVNDKKWELAKFEDVCQSRLGKMLDDKKQTGKHKRQYLRNFNVQWFRFDLSDIAEMDFDEKDRKEFRLQYGDILMCEGGEVGRCAIWKNQIEECYFQKALHRVRPNAELVKSEYLVHLFWWLAQTGGLGDFTSQVTIAHLTGEKLKELVIPVPPLSLQDEFAGVVARVEGLLALSFTPSVLRTPPPNPKDLVEAGWG
ncbi:MAG: restriction endonuclease subunit S [Chloroflexi bacterium]|nr:restriction endonuclease subunit S [Chloroflexota bacterium]